MFIHTHTHTHTHIHTHTHKTCAHAHAHTHTREFNRHTYTYTYIRCTDEKGQLAAQPGDVGCRQIVYEGYHDEKCYVKTKVTEKRLLKTIKNTEVSQDPRDSVCLLKSDCSQTRHTHTHTHIGMCVCACVRVCVCV
jgi:hypothetical protein